MKPQTIAKTVILTLLISPTLTGCHVAERLASVGREPDLSQIQNPTKVATYQPVSMPMPDPRAQHKVANSLWQTGSKAFFKDQRANKEGDVVTVIIGIDGTQSMDMTPEINREAKQNSSFTKFFNLRIGGKPSVTGSGVFPGTIDLRSNPTLTGKGKYEVKDKFDFTIASVVTQVLPNGSLVVEGRRELRLMNEVREVHLKGIVRKEDILASNTITHDKIAELRLSYGGRGDLSDMMKAPYGHQILNQVLPF